jgi:hypothetical protein
VAVGIGFDYGQDLGFRIQGIPNRLEIPSNRAQIHAGERT